MTLADRATMALATWFGAGYFPFASGTLATALALPVPLAVWLAVDQRWHGMAGAPHWNPFNLILAALLFWPGVAAASRAERLTGEHDSHKIVIDEVVGTWLTLAFLPFAAFGAWQTYAAAFLIFRVLDVAKPWIIGMSQVLPRGWGVMVDDVLAGLAGGVLLRLGWELWGAR
jgi:phosphatidylglycerophosphatase A